MKMPVNAPDDRFARLGRRGLIAVLAVSFLLSAVPLWWGLPSYQGWAFDEIAPKNLEGNAWPPKYPPVHRQVVRVALLPLDGLEALGWLDLEPLDRYSLRFLFLRLVSLLMATATVYGIYRCARLMFSRLPSVVAAAAVAFMPPFVYYAKTANLEAPYIFWFVLSLYFFLRALQDARLRDFVLFAIFGALSICTKDQAYGLYLLTPIPLLASLYARTSVAASVATRLRKTIFDRRVWLTALALGVVVIVAYRLYLGPEGLMRHIAEATGPRTFSVETPTPTGQLGRLLLALRQVAFSMSAPLALVAVAGAFVMARRRRFEALGIAVMAVGYYLGFLLVLPYQTVRYLLPIAMLASLLVAASLSVVGRFSRAGWFHAALGVLLGLALIRGLWVDLSMVADSRYQVESWLAQHEATDRTLAFGRPLTMPRGVTSSALFNLASGGCRFLDEKQPAYVLVNLADVRGEKEATAVEDLIDAEFNYDLAMRFKTRVPFEPHGVRTLLSNLDKINPEVLVFRRTQAPCLDKKNFNDTLDFFLQGETPGMRGGLAQFISTHDFGGRMGLPGNAQALAVGLHFGRWTRGAQPAVVVASNTLAETAGLVLQLSTLAPPEAFPLDVSIDDGVEKRRYTFKRRGKITVRAGELAPGERRLLIVESAGSWRSPQDDRVLGVNLNSVELQPAQP